MPYRASELKAPKGPRRKVPMWPLWGLAVLPIGVAGFVVDTLTVPRGPRAVALRMPYPAVACDRVDVLAERADGSRDVMCGSVRETLPAEGAATVAAERFDGRVVSATPVARGWVFVTEDGTVTRSDRFTGPLRLLGRVPCVAVRSHSVGRAVVLDGHGDVWTTDGGPLMKWELPRRVRSIAFDSATHGAVVFDRGELLVTGNAGGEWTRFDLQGAVAARVTVDYRGVLQASTTDGTQAIVGLGVSGAGRCFGDQGVDSPGRFGLGTDARASEASARAQEIFRVGTSDDRCEQVDAARGRASSLDSHRYHCAFSGTRRTPAGAQRVAPDPLRWVLMETATEHVEAEVTSGADSARIVRLMWRGRDARGAYTGQSGPALVGMASPLPGRGLWVEAVSRDGLLLDSPSHDVLLWARRGGPIGLLAEVPDCLETLTVLAVERPGGGVAWARWNQLGDEAIVTALEVGPDGVLRRRRSLAIPRTETVGLGRWDGVMGVVAWSSREFAATTFYPLDASPTRALPALPLTPPRACEAPAVPGGSAITLWRAGVRHAYDIPMEGAGTTQHGLVGTRYELEVTDGQTCVRSLGMSDGDIAGPTTLHAQPGDRFEGDEGDGVRLTCVGVAVDER